MSLFAYRCVCRTFTESLLGADCCSQFWLQLLLSECSFQERLMSSSTWGGINSLYLI